MKIDCYKKKQSPYTNLTYCKQYVYAFCCRYIVFIAVVCKCGREVEDKQKQEGLLRDGVTRIANTSRRPSALRGAVVKHLLEIQWNKYLYI